MAYLEIINLKKFFNKTEVLKDINFTLEKGEILTIIGSSGSGKTTLLRSLNFLEKADCGKILINNEAIFDSDRELSDKELRENRLRFGLVFQSFNLFPHLNALKNVTLAPGLLIKNKANKKEYTQKLKEIEIDAQNLLNNVGLKDKEKAYPYQLSGGQQQRLAIARALALKPDILCFDEPTSALDPELTSEVVKVIKSLKSSDRTMIVVTHEMDFAKKIADKVIFMADGVVEEIGTPFEVFNNPKSKKTLAFLGESTE
ncbi:MAG: amino acid ABC transporter ATP-binding protein [Bacilli bacterium]|nr:amino acid ABC transporter ATP-binding protein [Bacilli bacterium]